MTSKRPLPPMEEDAAGVELPSSGTKQARRERLITQTENMANVLRCLDRFSLDGARLTGPLLKAIIETHLADEPLLVLKKVLVKYLDGDDAFQVKMTAKAWSPTKVIGYKTKDPVRALRELTTSCSKCYVECLRFENVEFDVLVKTMLKLELPRIRVGRVALADDENMGRFDRGYAFEPAIQVMSTIQTLVLDPHGGDASDKITDKTLKMCAAQGVRQLVVGDGDSLTRKGIFDFCFSATANHQAVALGNEAERRLLYVHTAWLKKWFLRDLAKKCREEITKRPLPRLIIDDMYAEFMSEKFSAAQFKDIRQEHLNDGYCVHYRFDADTEPFEVVIREDHWLELRVGHGALDQCRDPRDEWDRMICNDRYPVPTGSK